MAQKTATTAMRSSFSLRLNVLFMLHHSFLNKKIQMKGLISKGNAFAIFSHPDFTALAFSPEQERASLPCRLANSAPPNSTVGSGISPDRLPWEFADYHCRYGISPIPKVMCDTPPRAAECRQVNRMTLKINFILAGFPAFFRRPPSPY
jgi:hypothetical protein